MPQRRAAARCRCVWPCALEPLLQQRARARGPCCRRRAGCARRPRRARARARRRCSPTAIRLKSVVPPPTSQTSTRSPTVTRRRQRVAERVEPRVERGLRLFEQRHVLEAGRLRPPAASARAPPRRTTPARSAARPASPAPARRRRRDVAVQRRARGAAGTRPTRRPARSAATSSGAPHGRIGAVRFAPPYDSHDFADATSRAGFSAPRVRASSPTTNRAASASHGSASAAGRESPSSPGR